MMESEKFWALIAQMKSGCDSRESHYESCKNVLQGLTENELVDFSVQLALLRDKAYDWNLWAAAYIINGGCSDDGFIDFRTGLVYQGKEVFESALKNPDSLVDLAQAPELIEYELFAYAPEYVFEERETADVDLGDLVYEKLYELPKVNSPHGEEWDEEDEDELRRRFPKLALKYLV